MNLEKFNQFLEDKFMPLAGRIGNQKHLQSVRDGLILTMPLAIAGSIFLILAFLPINGYYEFMTGIFGETWMTKFLYPVNVTFDLMAIFAVIGVSYRLAEKNKIDTLTSVALALMCFMMLTPFKITGKEEILSGIPLALTGSGGLFVAIISSLLSVELYTYIVKKNIVIKMPENVPPAVARSFTALIPAIAILLLSWGVRLAVETTDFVHLHNVINQALTSPLTKLAGTYLGVMTIILLIQLFWLAGLHGTVIVLGVLSPVLGIMGDQNRLAFQAGEEIPHILGGPFFDLYVTIGGSGGTFALALIILLVAKSQQLKEIGKLSIGATFFNINEPIIFGLPIIMNPYLMIPFLLTPLVTGSIAYFLIVTGFIAKLPGISIPWTTPPVINGYIASNGSLSIALLQIVLVFIGGAIYYPFIKIYDNEKLKEEKEQEGENERELLNNNFETKGGEI
ncbi:PTS cellobiose transporter subunit IIC [uncultured Cetobacterium sp.]|uniref:PTS cellobiose transporter subunit IIC n=1 Tax=uncultured Cetobacterium sp. TaxID=527638 RepID=UPI0026361A89|nr:PTS cellobiose transporter subunit IIC [uncultured Cetobacterium sp.]